jgi:hypothetical protein
MDSTQKRPRGGQPGNHNARKHGFYSRALKSPDRSSFEDASQVSGLDQEISLLRAQLKTVIQRDPENARLIALIASTLARLMRTNEKLAGSSQKNLDVVVLSGLAKMRGMDLKEFCEMVINISRKNLSEVAFGDPNNFKVPGYSPFDPSKK